MANDMKTAQALIFGSAGLRASNFKMFPGGSREVTSEMVAAEVVRVLSALTDETNAGKLEEVDDL